jgi:hypothetical protein
MLGNMFMTEKLKPKVKKSLTHLLNHKWIPHKYNLILYRGIIEGLPLFCFIYNSTNEKLMLGTKDKSISLYAQLILAYQLASYASFWFIF